MVTFSGIESASRNGALSENIFRIRDVWLEKNKKLRTRMKVHSRADRKVTRKRHETHLSAQHDSKKKNARISGSYEDARWKKGREPSESQGPKEALRIDLRLDACPEEARMTRCATL